MEDVMGFRQNIDHNVKCDGCGIIVGKGSPYGSTIYKVTDGAVKGTFHSRECYYRTVNKSNNDTDLESPKEE